MAHPMHAEAKSSTESKLKKLSGAHGTVDNPSGNKPAPGTLKEGPMKAIGLGVDGGKAKGNLGRYARGGAVKGKGTNVNIVISPAAAPAGPAGLPPSIMDGPKPPMPAPPPGPPPGMMGGAPSMPPGMPPGAPPMMPRKHGGSVKRADGGSVPMDKESEKKANDYMNALGQRKAGGRVGKYDAGAATGLGRLEKVANYGKKAKANIK